MILAIMLLYPLLSINREKCSRVYFPIISILLIGYLIQTHGTIIVIEQYSYFTFDGVKRAISEISFGCVLYEIHNYIKIKDFTRFGIIILSIIELFGYAITILFAWNNYGDISVIVLLFLGISICITFCQKGFITICLNKMINTTIFNKFSLSLFLSHMEIMEVFRYKKLYLESYDYKTVMIYYLLLSTAISIFNIVIVNLISKYINKKSINSLFVNVISK
ncbi:hypothetical protein LXJ15735_09630 [Lacrimispora xylanolytica]